MRGLGKFTVWLQKEGYLLHSCSLSLSSDSLFVSVLVIGRSSEMVAPCNGIIICYLINVAWCLIGTSLQNFHVLGLAWGRRQGVKA